MGGRPVAAPVPDRRHEPRHALGTPLLYSSTHYAPHTHEVHTGLCNMGGYFMSQRKRNPNLLDFRTKHPVPMARRLVWRSGWSGEDWGCSRKGRRSQRREVGPLSGSWPLPGEDHQGRTRAEGAVGRPARGTGRHLCELSQPNLPHCKGQSLEARLPVGLMCVDTHSGRSRQWPADNGQDSCRSCNSPSSRPHLRPARTPPVAWSAALSAH